jgi:hypothetical protein
MLSTKDVQRQITVFPIIAVKEPSFLLAVQGIVGRVDIQNDAFRNLGVRFQK